MMSSSASNTFVAILRFLYIGITFVGGGGVGGVVVGGVRISFAVSGDTSVSMKHV